MAIVPIYGKGTIDDPLTNIEGLAELQRLLLQNRNSSGMAILPVQPQNPAAINTLVPAYYGSSAEYDTLGNIPGLAEAQQIQAAKNREVRRSIANEAQPQDAETLKNTDEPEWRKALPEWGKDATQLIGNYGIGVWDTLARVVLNVPATYILGVIRAGFRGYILAAKACLHVAHSNYLTGTQHIIKPRQLL